MKGVQCYELFGGIALKNHAFSFFISYFQDCVTKIMIRSSSCFFIRKKDGFRKDFACNCLAELFESTMKFICEIEPSHANELRLCQCHQSYLADLHSKLNEIHEKLQGKSVTMIQARTVLFGFPEKLGLSKYSLGHGKFLYFQNLAMLCKLKIQCVRMTCISI